MPHRIRESPWAGGSPLRKTPSSAALVTLGYPLLAHHRGDLLESRASTTRTGCDLPSGDEAGTAPGDRPFRPDVEGLRAVAVLLVVLYHAGLSTVSGGYVGVDVFFVISGFVITGVLLRERARSDRTSLLHFYGRRCRRIIPAATLVIVSTIFLSYWFLGSVEGSRTATDGRWAAVFLANFHFIALGTSYLGSQRPPSPLQNYWSLAVEEQFYLVYPTLFLVLAAIRVRLSLRARLAIALGSVFCGSFAYSVMDTSSHPTGAYFSPFTRAWELALGALVAVGTPWLLKVPRRVAAPATWIGLGAIVVAAVTFTSKTAYPGSLVAIPVVGAALIIAGGVAVPQMGAEVLLRLAPLRFLGKISYSLYLWHWPILIVVAEHGGSASASFPGSLGWVTVAFGVSVATYYLVEDPIRHSQGLLRARWASVGLGAALVVATLGVATVQTTVAFGSGIAVERGHKPSSGEDNRAASLHEVLKLVAASRNIRSVPKNLTPSLSQAILQPHANLGGPPNCAYGITAASRVNCVFGDRDASPTIVLYGDSHAAMWFRALNDIAIRAKWRLIAVVRGGCPPSLFPANQPGVLGDEDQCAQFQQFAIPEIRSIDPELLIISQADDLEESPTTWRLRLESLVRSMSLPKTAKLILGNIPYGGGPGCLAEHASDVQACAVRPYYPFGRYYKADKLIAKDIGARYISVTPWFCDKRCSSVIGHFDVYFNQAHVAVGYTRFLEGVLAHALDLPGVAASVPRH